MIWIIIIILYLLLVALAFGFLAEMDDEHSTSVLFLSACTWGWLCIPFAISVSVGTWWARFVEEN